MGRGLWFVAGAGVGVYGMIRARRAAEALTPEGLRDRLAAIDLGAHLFIEEVRAGMQEKETELRERLAMALDGPEELPAPPEAREAPEHAHGALPRVPDAAPTTATPRKDLN